MFTGKNYETVNQQLPFSLMESKGIETGRWYSVTKITEHCSSFFMFIYIEMNDSCGSSIHPYLLAPLNEAESDEFPLTFT